MRGALRVASSPAFPPSLLWRHPAPGPERALGCRLLHSRVPSLPHPPLLLLRRPLPSQPLSGRLPAAVLQEPLAARAWGALRPEDAQASLEQILCLLGSQTGFCFFETELSICFPLAFCISPFLFSLFLTPRLSHSSLLFPHCSFLFGQFLIPDIALMFILERQECCL